MDLINRAKNILLTPKTEWPVVAAEASSTGSLMTYAAILALIPAVAGFLGAQVMLGAAAQLLGMGYFLTISLVSYAVGLGLIFGMGMVANALAPSFGGSAGENSGLKLVVYSGTSVWVAGILSFIPALAMIAALVGLVYAGYLIYLGCQSVLNVPSDKAGGFTGALIVIWIVASFIVSYIAVTIALSFAGPSLIIPAY